MQEEAERAAKEAAALKLKQASEVQVSVSCHGVEGQQFFSTAGICPSAYVPLCPQTLSSWLGDMGGWESCVLSCLGATGLAAGATHVSYTPCCAPYFAATHVSRVGARIGRAGSGRSSMPRPRRGSGGGCWLAATAAVLQPLQWRLAHALELSTTLMRGSPGRSCCRKRRLKKSGWSGSRSCRRSDKRKKPKKWQNKRYWGR